MDSQTLLSLCLVLHLTGFTLMAGTITADFSMYRRWKKHLTNDRTKAITILNSSEKFSLLISTGALLLILTGIGMVIIFHGVVARMLWFKIKMVLVLFILVNGILVGKQSGDKLRKALADGNGVEISLLENKLSIFYIVELSLFAAVVILSVFKF